MKIAILTPNKEAHTETFIQNHIKHLPFKKVVVYGGKFPFITDKMLPTVWQRRQHRLSLKLRTIAGLKMRSFQESQLRKILVSEKVEVVFAEYLTTGAEVAAVCKDLKIPLVSIALGYEISVYAIIEKYKEKYRALFEYASKLIVVSNHMKKNMVSLGCDASKIVYSPAGPASDFFELNPTFQKKQFFAIGRFIDKKAPHLTLLAFKEVYKKYSDVSLVMAGDGPLLQVCKDLAIYLGLKDIVEFVGRISQEEQRQFLEESYAFLQHSKVTERGDSEGTPVAILEASAAGLPIISTLHAGIPDVVIQNKTGLLCKENDVLGMANYMIALLENNNKAKIMGQHGKHFVKDNFSLELHIKTLQSVLEHAR